MRGNRIIYVKHPPCKESKMKLLSRALIYQTSGQKQARDSGGRYRFCRTVRALCPSWDLQTRYVNSRISGVRYEKESASEFLGTHIVCKLVIIFKI